MDKIARGSAGEAHEKTWMLNARCRGTDPETFFPSDGSSSRAAQRLCVECPVRAECLEYALVNRIEQGVWGGASQRERRRMLSRRRQPVAAMR